MAKSRYVRMVKTTYAEIDRDTADNKVNKELDIINQNGGKVINITHNNMGVGISTVYWVFVIVYEADNEIPTSVFENCEPIEKRNADKSRYVKMVKTTYTEIDRDVAEQNVNRVSAIISEHGGKVINISHNNIGVGFSTVYWVFVVTYEAEKELPASLFE